MLDDVLVVLQRAEMTTRMAEEIERNCVELGEEGRLIRMQLDELMEDVPREKAAVVYDYERRGDAAAWLDRARAPLKARLRAPARVRGARRAARLSGATRTRSTSASAARLPRALTRSRASRTRSSATSCATSRASTRSSARATATSRRWTGSARCAPGRSARGCGACRSTIWSIVTSSSSAAEAHRASPNRVSAEKPRKFAFQAGFRYNGCRVIRRRVGRLLLRPRSKRRKACTKSATRSSIPTTALEPW